MASRSTVSPVLPLSGRGRLVLTCSLVASFPPILPQPIPIREASRARTVQQPHRLAWKCNREEKLQYLRGNLGRRAGRPSQAAFYREQPD